MAALAALAAGYDSDSPPTSPSASRAAPPPSSTALISFSKDSAPAVAAFPPPSTSTGSGPIALVPTSSSSSTALLRHNPKLHLLAAPAEGPLHPRRPVHNASGAHRTGEVERAWVEGGAFDDRLYSCQAYGIEGVAGRSVWTHRSERKKKPGKKVGDEEAKVEGEGGGGMEAAVAAAMAKRNLVSPWAKVEVVKTPRTEEALEYENWRDSRRKKRRGKDEDEEGEDGEGRDDEGGDAEKSTFHGKSETDYAGNSWILAPKDKKKQGDRCYAPKRCIFTWSGHTKGVSAVRFFPNSGHMILSAGLDSKVKIWDVYNSGKCMRTYMGHSQGVKDIQFSNDGRRFLTASFDRYIKLWDTETGKVLEKFTTGRMPNCVRFHPDDDKQNIMLAGMGDNKIVQFDMDTGNLEQEYNYHLGPVNTITFVDENRRFITSSDDKSMRVWEFGTPVVIKYIADPAQHSMPAVTRHPNNNYIACQSLDNQIVVFSTKERFRKEHKKCFKGHTNSGYACKIGFSPDGRFLMSGDANGRCWFWDWKTSRIFSKLKAHEGVCIDCEWHPLETSKVVTCGWDGLIKYWD